MKGKFKSLKQNLIIILVCFLVVLLFASAIVFINVYVARRKKRDNKVFAIEKPGITKVGYSAEYLGTVNRNVPTTTSNGGLGDENYPTYGYTKNLSAEQKNLIIDESRSLCGMKTFVDVSGRNERFGDTYDAMDKDGNLYLRNVKLDRKLYKHSASVGLYSYDATGNSDVSASEPGVIKRINLKSRGAGYNITGLYAPAGEVIKIQISAKDLQITSGLNVLIGQALYNTQANNIWAAKGINRMPLILNQLVLVKPNENTNPAIYSVDNDTYTFYVGSFMGGPIYIQPGNNSAEFSVTISGAVNYSHFILGYTTREEFEQNAKSSAPYFDLMVWDGGVLHSGPKRFAQSFSYDQLYDAAVLWDKISIISTYGRNNPCGIVFLYDCFVAAGAAVAFPGRMSVNCPAGWMPNSLNYESFVNSGAWGNMHEFNHNYQGWGFPGGGEVTNNALNLVSYSLFTRISSNRQIGSVNEGLGGWNRYTSGSWAVRQLYADTGRENDLSIYAALLHSFGQDAFLNTKVGGTDNYLTRWSEYVHYDMTYFSELIGKTMSDTTKQTMQEKNYPMFVPVASIYQTGRSYNYNGGKKYIETVQPYKIAYGDPYTVDLRRYTFSSFYESGSIAIPNRFEYIITNITQPQHGTLTKTDTKNVYTFTPDANLRSGKIYVTLSIVDTQHEFEVDDVDLVLEFEQNHEMNKTIIKRTVYKSNTGAHTFATAKEAYDNNFANYSVTYNGDNKNASQNANTEIWIGNNAEQGAVFMVLNGKLYIEETAKYRITLRGRHSMALALSLDGVNYNLMDETLEANESMSADVRNDKYHFDYSYTAGTWVYFKATLMVKPEVSNGSYIGIGIGKLLKASAIYNENGQLIDTNGNVITEEDYEQMPETASITYANAYRSSYQFINNKFTTEYFYKRSYSAPTLSSIYDNSNTNATIVSVSSNTSWDSNTTISAILDKDDTNHFNSGKNFVFNADNPYEFVVDLGQVIEANRCIIQGYHAGSNWYTPNSFTLYAGTSLDNLKQISSFTNGEVDNLGQVAFNFGYNVNMRYYKLSISGSKSGGYIAFHWIKFMNNISGGKQYSPDENMFTFKGGWNTENPLSTFGHVYVANRASVEFEFIGTRFGLISNLKNYKNDFEVYIDNERVESIVLNYNKKDIDYSFVSNQLSNSKHKVVIKSKVQFSVDSIVLWQ